MGFHPLAFSSFKTPWKGDFQRAVCPVPLQHYLFLACVGAGGSFSCISSKSAFSHSSYIPSLKDTEVASQAWLCVSSNPICFNKHPSPGAAAWTVTSNMSLSIWITRERDLSCCRRFTYGIFTGAAQQNPTQSLKASRKFRYKFCNLGPIFIWLSFQTPFSSPFDAAVTDE